MNVKVWVFVATNGRFPAGVFQSKQIASEWIAKHSLSGMLAEFPVDFGVYDWVIERGWFHARDPSQRTAEFIGAFTSAYLPHCHFENGAMVAE